jgi:hypothetical protein
MHLYEDVSYLEDSFNFSHEAQNWLNLQWGNINLRTHHSHEQPWRLWLSTYLKDITLITTVNARAGLHHLLKFCPRKLLLSLQTIILFLLLVRRQFSLLTKWGVAMSMALTTRGISRRSTRLIIGMRTFNLRVYVLLFPTAFTRTKGFGIRWL